ncbi:peroxidase-related enzyme [Ensifer sesbaniae]|jgi:uncharacterized peroxidase-related enzyme|uniref:carboxymuconolactone decarboxylase family protein n=1 Tax=Ensifer sesbaniae TaxID=1214071 RepID=UPI002000C3AD|nr:peroxidase-related enzyme [Ensifer sesbaniae]
MTQRIPSIQPNAAAGKTAALFDSIKAKIGLVPNIYKVLAQSPTGLDGVLQFSGALAGGNLDAATRERIALAVANVNGCDYCNAAHTAVAKSLKLSDEEIEANRQGYSSDARATVAVAFARKVAMTRADVSEADIQALRQAGYSDAQIVEIVLNVAFNVVTNYVNEAFQIDIDFPRVAPATRVA